MTFHRIVNAHSDLTGLTADDHPQYQLRGDNYPSQFVRMLLVDTSRALGQRLVLLDEQGQVIQQGTPGTDDDTLANLALAAARDAGGGHVAFWPQTGQALTFTTPKAVRHGVHVWGPGAYVAGRIYYNAASGSMFTMGDGATYGVERAGLHYLFLENSGGYAGSQKGVEISGISASPSTKNVIEGVYFSLFGNVAIHLNDYCWDNQIVGCTIKGGDSVNGRVSNFGVLMSSRANDCTIFNTSIFWCEQGVYVGATASCTGSRIIACNIEECSESGTGSAVYVGPHAQATVIKDCYLESNDTDAIYVHGSAVATFIEGNTFLDLSGTRYAVSFAGQGGTVRGNHFDGDPSTFCVYLDGASAGVYVSENVYDGTTAARRVSIGGTGHVVDIGTTHYGQRTFDGGLLADTVGEVTANAGVTADSVLLKDGAVGLLAAGSNRGTLTHGSLSAARTWTFPNRSLTVGLSDDLRSSSTNRTAAATLSDTATEVQRCDLTGGAFTLTLQAASSSNLGKVFLFVKTDASANALTVSNLLGGNRTVSVQGGTLMVQSTGTEWVVI